MKHKSNQYPLFVAVAGAVHDGDVLHHAVPHVRRARHGRRPRIRLQGSGGSDFLSRIWTEMLVRDYIC